MATISETLGTAVRHHQGGNLAEAERLYREILETQPKNPNAWHLLGLIAYQRGDAEAARRDISRAIEFDGAQPTFFNHLAEAHKSLHEFAEAEACCRQALALKPDFAVAHNTLGNILLEQGKTQEAIDAYQEAIRCQGDFALAYCNLGDARAALGEYGMAAQCYRHAIHYGGDYAAAYHHLGATLEAQGKTHEAEAAHAKAWAIDPRLAAAAIRLGALCQQQSRLAEAANFYRQALALEPHNAHVHCNLGSIYKEQGILDQAVACYRQALACDADLAAAHFNLGIVLQHERQMSAAAACYRQAIRCKPDHAEAYNNLGTIYRLEYNLAEAIACYDRAMELKPNFAEALNNLGNTFKIQGRHAEAQVCYEQTLRIKPEYAQAHYNHALALLSAGTLAAGWSEYEWRWKCPDFPQRAFDKPAWDGGPLNGRKLLVHAEQGLGDTLQFARYVPLLIEHGEKVIFEVADSLRRILSLSGFTNLVSKGAAESDYDVHVPLLSLPLILGTTLETIPARIPYLRADPELVGTWREKLRVAKNLKVGIAWQGSPTLTGDRFRSILLGEFKPLAQPNVQLFSLQKGPGREQLAALAGEFDVLDLGNIDEDQGAFMDTAAIMENLDLVVTCDTVIGHLAGALGVPVWVALNVAPDWRWMLERPDTPWYPTMRLFRQTKFDRWAEVFAEMSAQLRPMATKSK